MGTGRHPSCRVKAQQKRAVVLLWMKHPMLITEQNKTHCRETSSGHASRFTRRRKNEPLRSLSDSVSEPFPRRSDYRRLHLHGPVKLIKYLSTSTLFFSPYSQILKSWAFHQPTVGESTRPGTCRVGEDLLGFKKKKSYTGISSAAP